MAKSVYFDQSPVVDETLRKEKQTKLFLKELYKQVKILQEEKDSLKQDIQFLLLNFGYILELGKKNITEGLNRKIAEILSEKYVIIKKQRQQLKKYESQVNLRKGANPELELEKVKNQFSKIHEEYEKAK